ncbi:MAG TPA: tetratricopeptide repeat protein [Longimicrobiales bacterium]|nr:tetratricopeptide repeat protein [Longimicrobiales bacterium]
MTLNESITTITFLALLALGIGDFEHGNRHYRAGRYAEAVAAYRAALEDGEDRPELQYNLGTALLRLGEYDAAQRHLEAALADVDPELRQRALYNLGNRFLLEGRATGEAQQRDRLLDAAVEAYRDALRLRPSDADAKWNLEMALREQEQPPESPQQDEQEQQDERDEQAGGGGEQPRPNAPQGDEPRGSGDSEAPLTPDQAEQILNAVEQDERELYQEQLRRGARETPVVRDW